MPLSCDVNRWKHISYALVVDSFLGSIAQLTVVRKATLSPRIEEGVATVIAVLYKSMCQCVLHTYYCCLDTRQDSP